MYVFRNADIYGLFELSSALILLLLLPRGLSGSEELEQVGLSIFLERRLPGFLSIGSLVVFYGIGRDLMAADKLDK